MKNKKTNNSHWGNSLRFLSWDDSEEVTPGQELISSTIHEWYDAKHREVSLEEVKLINSVPVEFCPYCGGTHIVRCGHYGNGIQRYLCVYCNVKFSPLTNTIFENKKIPISEWIEYLLHLFEFHSIVTSARDNRNAETTGKYWLIKVFMVLKNIQDPVRLHGTVYFDEMFFPVIKNKEVMKDGKKLRGISRNKIAVATAFDESGNLILIDEQTSKPSKRSTLNALESHIEPGSHLIHDGDSSHNALIKKLYLTSEVHTSSETKGLKDNENPLDPINDLHSLAKRFMKAHGGYDRNNLQDWMNLIWFILSEPQNRYEKVLEFITLALNSPIKAKYRDVMGKKHDD